MNTVELKRVLDGYREAMLIGGGVVRRFDEEQYDDEFINDKDKFSHVLWACDQVELFAKNGGDYEKLNRWFGWLQGVMWAYNLSTLNELRADSIRVKSTQTAFTFWGE